MGQPEAFEPVQFQLHHEVGHGSRDPVEPDVLTKSTQKQQDRWEETEESEASSSHLPNIHTIKIYISYFIKNTQKWLSLIV